LSVMVGGTGYITDYPPALKSNTGLANQSVAIHLLVRVVTE
jgi:hypothetical protein